jgi:hypothetical protein
MYVCASATTRLPHPKLYGLSVLGIHMRVYGRDKARRTVLRFDYLENEWSINILSDDGFSEMKWIVKYRRNETANPTTPHSEPATGFAIVLHCRLLADWAGQNFRLERKEWPAR